MKARLLKKMLNADGVFNIIDEIRVAVNFEKKLFRSFHENIPMYSLDGDVIKIDKETLRMSSCNCLEKSLTDIKFKTIWDKLIDLIDSGELRDIIDGKDIIENPIPVFTVRNSIFIESSTDVFEYRNIDDDGYVIHEYSHFRTKDEALDYGINYNIKYIDEAIKEKKKIEKELVRVNYEINRRQENIDRLRSLKETK